MNGSWGQEHDENGRLRCLATGFYLKNVTMLINTKIDFEDTYELLPIGDGVRKGFFNTELIDGEITNMKIEISEEPEEWMPNVYNMGYGLVDARGEMDDKVNVEHANYSKMFSTVLSQARRYLSVNPKHEIGIDGSDERRTKLYYRLIKNNYLYLSRYFKIFGVKYYVRLTRLGKNQYDNPFDFKDISFELKPLNENIENNMEFMYNYFVFKLK
jgi:hypothetical protein